DVAPGQGDRQGQGLDRGAAGESGRFESGLQGRMQFEAGEGDIGKWLVAHGWDLVCGSWACRVPGSHSRSAWVAALRGDAPLCGDPNGLGSASGCMTRSGACVGGARIADCLGNGTAPEGAFPGARGPWARGAPGVPGPGLPDGWPLIRAANPSSLPSIPAAARSGPPSPSRSLS